MKAVVFSMVVLGLAGCQDSRPEVSHTTSQPVTGVPVSALDREALRARFNHLSCGTIEWPSTNQNNLVAAGLLANGVGRPLPHALSAKFQGHPPHLLDAATDVYQRSIVRGMDDDLIGSYFASKMGRDEIQANYAVRLAKACSNGVPSSINVLANKWMKSIDHCAPRPEKFVCISDPILNERR